MEVLGCCETALSSMKEKKADGNLLMPKDGFPKAVPLLLFFWKRLNAHKTLPPPPPPQLWCIVLSVFGTGYTNAII